MLEKILMETALIDAIRLGVIAVGVGLIGSLIGYAKRYARVQKATGLGLSGTWPVFAILTSMSLMVLERLTHHFAQFHEPPDFYFFFNPIVFGLGTWGAVKANRRMREMDSVD